MEGTPAFAGPESEGDVVHTSPKEIHLKLQPHHRLPRNPLQLHPPSGEVGRVNLQLFLATHQKIIGGVQHFKRQSKGPVGVKNRI